jgi:hypothetical protein
MEAEKRIWAGCTGCPIPLFPSCGFGFALPGEHPSLRLEHQDLYLDEPAELAAITRTDERYVREWLASQAAGGYITYNPQTHKFGMTEEQALTLANEDGPAYLPGAFELALGSLAAVPRITEAFRSGAAMGWGEHEDRVFHGCEKLFRPGYAANLVSSWIPALDGVHDKLVRVQGVASRVTFEVAKAKEFPGKEYDFVAVFDCLHLRCPPIRGCRLPHG